MSANLFHTPLVVPLQSSARLMLMSGLMVLLAIASILLTGLSITWKCALLLALLLMVWLEYYRQQRNRHWRQLRHDAAGNWWLIDHGGQKKPLELDSGCYFSAHLAVIHGRCVDRKVLLWVWRYQYPQQTFRRLSLYLRGSVIE